MSGHDKNGLRERTGNVDRDAAILFARAMELFREGKLNRALKLFDQVIAVCEENEALSDGLSCVAAHISLYKIHRALGHDREAREHFQKATSLGASAQRLREI